MVQHTLYRCILTLQPALQWPNALQKAAEKGNKVRLRLLVSSRNSQASEAPSNASSLTALKDIGSLSSLCPVSYLPVYEHATMESLPYRKMMDPLTGQLVITWYDPYYLYKEQGLNQSKEQSLGAIAMQVVATSLEGISLLHSSKALDEVRAFHRSCFGAPKHHESIDY